MSLQSSKDADREGATKVGKNYVLDLPMANIKIPLQLGAIKQETWGEELCRLDTGMLQRRMTIDSLAN